MSRQRLGSARLGSAVAAKLFSALHTQRRPCQQPLAHIVRNLQGLPVRARLQLLQVASALLEGRTRSPAARLLQQVNSRASAHKGSRSCPSAVLTPQPSRRMRCSGFWIVSETQSVSNPQLFLSGVFPGRNQHAHTLLVREHHLRPAARPTELSGWLVGLGLHASAPAVLRESARNPCRSAPPLAQQS